MSQGLQIIYSNTSCSLLAGREYYITRCDTYNGSIY